MQTRKIGSLEVSPIGLGCMNMSMGYGVADDVVSAKLLNEALEVGLSEISSDTLRRSFAEYPVAAVQSEYSLWSRTPEFKMLETCTELGRRYTDEVMASSNAEIDRITA